MTTANTLEVLNHGYVRLVSHMGDDLSVVNAARVSFAKESQEMSEGDARLVRYLLRHGHSSPFRHAFVKFEVKAPLLVARQWWKYVVGSDHTMDGWNEVSRRYVQDEPEFYIPEVWRSAPENKKQGSGEAVAQAGWATSLLELAAVDGVKRYELAVEAGICVEQARLFLPAYALYTSWIWTCSLQSLLHFLSQRLADDAQWEIQQYAQAVHALTEPLFPVVFAASESLRSE